MRVIVIFFVILGIALTACTREKENKKKTTLTKSDEAAQREAEVIIKRELEKMEKKEAVTFPCSLFKTDEIIAINGNPVESGAYTFNHMDEDGRKFRAAECAWLNKEEGGGTVNLWVSRIEHFDSGKVECYPPPGKSGPGNLAGIGTAAYWDFVKYFGMGTLRVCSEKALFEVKINKKGADEGAVQGMARKVAEKALAGS